MELSTNTTAPKPPKRQETLGPASPIQDWEVERATVSNYHGRRVAVTEISMIHQILADRKESREKAERLEKKLELDRQTYEKNTASVSHKENQHLPTEKSLNWFLSCSEKIS